MSICLLKEWLFRGYDFEGVVETPRPKLTTEQRPVLPGGELQACHRTFFERKRLSARRSPDNNGP